MKIIIMTGKFGMGHYVAAEAISQKIKENHNIKASVEIIDWLQYITPNHADKFYRLFSIIMSNGSKFYNKRYRILENRKTDQKPELYRYFLHQFAKLMTNKHPDLIISTLPLCSQIVSLYIDKYRYNIPLITCITDITGHSEWVSRNTDLYLVGSELVKQKLILKGVPSHKIFETGIPVKSDFSQASSAPPPDIAGSSIKILIMGGGLGIIPTDLDFYRKLDQLSGLDITVITGNNKRLYNRLCGKYPHLQILGYVNNVHEYMNAADVVITKPGGITTFEAIHSGVPIIALNPFLQQEIYNAEYIIEHGIGIVVQGNSDQYFNQIKAFLNKKTINEYKIKVKSQKDLLENHNIMYVIQYAIEALCSDKYIDYNSKTALAKEYLNEEINFNF